MTSRLNWRWWALISGEGLLLAGAIGGVTIALDRTALPQLAFHGILFRVLIIACATQLCFYYSDLYDARVFLDHGELQIRLIQALGATSLLLALVYWMFPRLVLGHWVFVVSVVPVIMLVAGWRRLYVWLTHRVRPRERLLLVGTSEGAVKLARELFERRQQLGVEIVGFVDPDPARVGAPVLNPGVIGTLEDIPAVVARQNIDRVVVSLADARGKLPVDRLLAIRLATGIPFDHLPSVYEKFTGKIAIDNLRPSWLLFSPGFRKTRALAAAKRSVDLVVAVVALIALSPIMLAVAAAIRLSSPGPVLYHQQRVGQGNRIFTIHKFRSMRPDAERGVGAVWAVPGADPRVTWIGRVLRRTRLDELPQIWNILRGEMSLVGPRPERPEFVGKLTEQIPFYGLRHTVKPGLTGWAQVRYTYGSTVEDAMEKLQYDLFYVKNLSLTFDVLIILDTLRTVLAKGGS
jgi:sugar transferase (PEP-CTERM system associated)